ncbi:hypothetical protein IMSAGC021_01305 [Muribaculaceae bacterium]|nr:hypothetical protein IMSAGC021_01305 [Muribaculaceae bacterium]
MDAQRVEVFHVADSDAVVKTVAHHFIFHFLPAFERLFHKDLRRECEGFLNESHEFFLIVTETAAEAAEGIGRTDNHRIAEGLGSHTGIVDRVDGLALDGLDLNLVKFLDE